MAAEPTPAPPKGSSDADGQAQDTNTARTAEATATGAGGAEKATEQKEPEPERTTIASKETTILRVGANGEIQRKLSTKPLAEVDQIIVVYDPRCMACYGGLKDMVARDSEEWKKTSTFMLMPSLTSSPECLLCAEMSLYLAGLGIGPEENLRWIRIDDYLHHGDKIVVAMLEEDKWFYPAEEAESLMGFYKQGTVKYTEKYEDPDEEPPEEEPGVEESSRFEANLWSVRAWVTCAFACKDFEEGCVFELKDEMLPNQILPMLSDASKGLPSLGPVPSTLKAPSPVFPSKSSLVFVTFSEASAEKYGKIFKSVQLCNGWNLEEPGLPEGYSIDGFSPQAAALLTDKDKACLTIAKNTADQVPGWEAPPEEEEEEDAEGGGQKEGAERKKYKEEFGIESVGDHLDSISNKIRFLNGTPMHEALGGIFKPRFDESPRYPVFLIEPEDFVGETGAETYTTVVERCMFQTTNECIAVVFGSDFASFGESKWMPQATSVLVDNTDTVIFATHAEAEQVANFFQKSRYETEDVGLALRTQMKGNPMAQFLTLASALGQELEDGELIAPAMTVGTQLTNVPVQKFSATSPASPFFLTDQDFKPLTERLLPSVDGFDGATLVVPAKLMQRLLGSFIPKDAEYPGTADFLGEAYGNLEDGDLHFAFDAVKDLISTYEETWKGTQSRKMADA